MTVTLRPFSRLDGMTYGPVSSRRYGRSLGLNVFPGSKKACSFECPYCQLGFAKDKKEEIFPTSILAEPDDFEQEVRRAVKESDLPLDCLTFSGNGEPSAHPQFLEIVKRTEKVRNELTPKSRIVALTNGAHCDRPDVVEALNRCDEAVVKLDAGTEKTFQLVNEPRRKLCLADLVEGIRKLQNITIQTMFINGRIDNTADEEIEAWIDHIQTIRPSAVQIYTLDRVPADESLTPVSNKRLTEISKRLELKSGIQPLLFLPS